MSRESMTRLASRSLLPTMQLRYLSVVFVLLVSSLSQQLQASDKLEISQVRQLRSGETKVRVYADLLNAEGQPSGQLGIGDVAATLGRETAAITGVRSFADSREGVGFIFLVDISLSLTEDHFAQIRQALDGWISRLRPQDRAALISFGSQSRILVDWTSDLQQLREALSGLAPSDRDTLLYNGIFDALDLGERRDPELPGRRVVVVLTDGRDEGSGRALEDVLEEIRRRPLPVYAIGFSQLQGAQRVTYLDVLRRLASNSGGAFFEAERTQFAEAYERIAEAVHRVWVVDLDCAQCIPDGRALRLQLSVRSGNRVLSRGTDLRLLPQAVLPSRPTATPSATSPGDDTDSSVESATGAAQPNTQSGADAPTIPAPVESTAAEQPVDPSGDETATVPPAVADTGVTAPNTGTADSGIKGSPALWLGLIALMVGLIVVGLLARRAASSSEVTAEMVRTELNRALEARGEAPASSATSNQEMTSGGLEAATPMPAGGAAPTPTPSSGHSAGQIAAAAAAAAAKAAEEVQAKAEAEARARHREELVERALLDHANRRHPTSPQALFVPRTIRLVTVRGTQKGKQYRGIVREALTVGARSTNDLVLVDEPNAPAELFEIYQDDYRIQLRGGDQQRVLCNGLPTEYGQEIRSGDLVGTKDLIFRVVLDE